MGLEWSDFLRILLKNLLDADNTTLWAETASPSSLNKVISKKSCSFLRVLNVLETLDWKSFHLRQNLSIIDYYELCSWSLKLNLADFWFFQIFNSNKTRMKILLTFYVYFIICGFSTCGILIDPYSWNKMNIIYSLVVSSSPFFEPPFHSNRCYIVKGYLILKVKDIPTNFLETLIYNLLQLQLYCLVKRTRLFI